MPVLTPRIRTIGVRLSEDEYSSLEKFCAESGARSISDLARAAIYSFVNRANQESLLASTVSKHAMQVKKLQKKIDRLSTEVASIRTSVFPAQNSKSQHSQRTNENAHCKR